MTNNRGSFKKNQGSGDDGFTDLPGGARISKDSARVRAFAAIDETSCALGLCRAGMKPDELPRLKPFIPEIKRIQKSLIYAAAVPAGLDYSLRLGKETARLKPLTNAICGKLPKASGFIIPGDTKAGALLHCARASCRTAETFLAGIPGAEASAVYLNRVSDFLFLLARLADEGGPK